ncbi:MAG: hypothetical protein RIS76_337, partial [Verrucomicrobiota bacterium]
EVLYGRNSTVTPLGYWLPAARYGLPAGFNDLPQSARTTTLTLLNFSDDGIYYGQTLLPHSPNAPETEWAVLVRGSVAGESVFDSVFAYKPGAIFPGVTPSNDREARQRFVAGGVTSDGMPWGRVDVMIKPVGASDLSYDLVSTRPFVSLQGLFRGSQFLSVPGEAEFPECGPNEGFNNSLSTLVPAAASRNGTFLTKSLDKCINFPSTTKYTQTLAVVGTSGARIVSVKGTGLPEPEIDPDSYGGVVDDRGDAAGYDARGLWRSSMTGSISRLPPADPPTSALLNNAGWILVYGSELSLGTLSLWDGQTLLPMEVPWAALGYKGNFFPRQLNDRGEILGVVRGTADNLLHGVLLTPVLALDLAATPRRVAVGDRFTVTATVTNISRENLTVLAPRDLLEYSGKGGLELVTGPVPPQVPALAPNGHAQFTWTLLATNAGPVRFSVAVQALRAGAVVESAPASTEIALVDRSADLLIKRAGTPDSAYAIAGFQVPTASGAQFQTVLVKSNEVAAYDVRLRNVGRETRSFTLLALENGTPNGTGWHRRYFAGEQDLTALLSGPAGFTTPMLPTNGVFNLRLSLTPTNVSEHGEFSVSVVAADEADAGTAMDAVEVRALLSQMPVVTHLQRLAADGLTTESIRLGRTRPNEPLEPRTDPAVLAAQPEIHSGLVADGVTPLLIELSAHMADLRARDGPQKFRVRAEITGGGSLDRTGIEGRLRVRHGNEWTSNLAFELSVDQPRTWVQLTPIAADELRLVDASEVSVRLEVVSDDAEATLHGSQSLRLRHPPIALIHGYNTGGDWDPLVLIILSAARGGSVGDDDSFVRVCRYATDTTDGYLGPVSRLFVYENTVYPLRVLAPLAEASFQQAMAPLAREWAFTRHDVVAHSQGGLLTRMLCSQRANDFVGQPFRNEANFYRGRFHRVVTIGSPHNGSRLLRYLLSLGDRAHDALAPSLPAEVARLMIVSDAAQDKFDPFGGQIQELNDPDPDGPWQPDRHAPFHLVRALINGGLPPAAAHHTPADLALNLATPGGLGGRLVIPRGSDGVVDFDSMGAHGPHQQAGANVWTHPTDISISHSPPLFLWNSTVGETASVSIARHVVAALDQDPSIPAADRVFGRFVPPDLLTRDILEGIHGFAALAIPVGAGPTPLGGALRSAGGGAGTYRFQLPNVPEYPVAGEILWSAVAYGPEGFTREGLEVTEFVGNPTRATVTVDPELEGDVVLYASYLSTTGARVYLLPVRVTTQGLSENNIVGLEVFPRDLNVPVGAELPVEIQVRTADGRFFPRFVAPGQAQVLSEPPGIIDVSNPLRWTALSPGTTDIITTYAGLRATNRLAVFVSGPVDRPLELSAQLEGADLVLSWPAAASAVLQSASALNAVGWQPFGVTPAVEGGVQMVRVSPGGNPGFFRLVRAGGPIDPGGTPQERLGGTYGWNRSGPGGAWSNPANWDSSAIAGSVPVIEGLDFIDIAFGPAAEPVTSTVDGVFGIRSLTFGADAPDANLAAGAGGRLDLGVGGLSLLNSGTVTVEVPIRLASDQTWHIEGGTVTLAALEMDSHALSVTGAGTLVVRALGGTAASRLTVQGPGRMEAGVGPGSLPFSGTLAITGGSLNSGVDPINGAAAVEVAGGFLTFPANAVVSSSATLRLSGGTAVLNGATGTLGALQLRGSATLKLGTGTTPFRFAGSSLVDANSTLMVSDWTGTAGASGTGRKLVINPAPEANFLARIRFEASSFELGSSRLASGEIVPLLRAPSVLPVNPLAQALPYGVGQRVRVVPVTGEAFPEALEIITTQKPAQVFTVGSTLKTAAAVAANDNLLARFWIRKVAPVSGRAQVMFNFEQAGGAFEKSVQLAVTLTDANLQLKTVKFKSRAAYAAGAAELSFWAGYGVQTVQVGGLEVLNYQGVTPP